MPTTLTVDKYDQIEQWCKEQINSGSDLLFRPALFRKKLLEKSTEWEFPVESLHSLLRNLHVSHVKKTAPQIKRNLQSYIEEYASKGTSIASLAKEANYPPYLFCRYFVEQVAIVPGGRQGLMAAMRDPLTVLGSRDVIAPSHLASEDLCRHTSSTRLAIEVREALDTDPLYGPDQDQHRHMVGIEYEVVLEDALNSMKIPFETESQLREKGTSRTPDVLLQCPIGVKVGSEWKVVCWIDSKALFGDMATHRTSVLPQAESYVHRFGPGMILYWFGHAPLEKLGHDDLVIQAFDLPQQFLWPTGELGCKPDPSQ